MQRRVKSIRNESLESGCEDIWVTVEIGDHNKYHQITFCGIYLSPPVQKTILKHFIDNFSKISDKINSNVCIVGDFNLGTIDWEMESLTEGYQTSSLNQLFIDFVNLNGFKQFNSVKNRMNRILDLVLVDFSNIEVSSSVDRLCSEDPLHPPIVVVLPLVKESTLSYNSINCKRNFHKVDYQAVNNYLAEIKWEDLFMGVTDVNVLVNMFYREIEYAIDKFVPVSGKSRNKYPPWYSNCLIRRLKEKEKYRKKYNKFHNPLDNLSYRLLSERCSKLTMKCYRDFLAKTEQRISRDPKYFWSYVKQKRGGTSSIPAVITEGTRKYSNGDDICNLFATHFSSSYMNPNKIIPASVYGDLNCCCQALGMISVDREQIIKLLKSIDVSKGAGSDGIPPIFIVSCASALVDPLYIIFRTSLCSGVFPLAWKTAKVVPLHKSGSVHSIRNYRPISILPIFSKVLEQLVYPYIQSHYEKYASDRQHGFLNRRSTITNLVEYVEDITERLDKNEQVDAIYTDFSRAFDRVVHDILLQKLSYLGFTGVIHKWINSYLTCRSFYVVVNGFQSNIHGIASGVPQGSHLGPVLFNIFINDLPQIFQHCTPLLFADDLKIYKTIKSCQDAIMFQNDVRSLEKWCSHNGVDLNIAKCFHIKFTRKHHIIQSHYKLKDTEITEVDVVKDLGIILDRKLTFQPHIDYIIKRASRMLGFVLRNAKFFKNYNTKMVLFNILVRSCLEYGSVVWRPHFSTHSLRIERIQKRFVRHLASSIGNSNRNFSYKRALEGFKLTSLESRRIISDLVFLFKLFNSTIYSPQLLSKLFIRVPARMPRKPIPLFVPPRRRTVLGSHSPIARITKQYNECAGSSDTDLCAVSLYKFKNHLFQKYK
ncbi:unnamed protein product [Euphydryas editha]|uniref:Reverse transcriptase domain-containing protein n=1 Tax=Euphydryas editha TaxID=104508 RepID=A0AAU9U9A9_EUPED|nr:unnamed protein product [Euphydryas editha]